MTEDVKRKSVNMEDMQAHSRVLHNKGIGSDGTCTTAAGNAAKAVTLGTTFSLVSGATIIVTFQNGITVAGATLAVTHTPLGASSAVTEAAKPIYYRGAALPANAVKGNDKIILRYNGAQFDVIGHLDSDTDTVTDISYDAATGKLSKTVNGTTTEVCDIVQSGFVPTFNAQTGIMDMKPVGGATITPDATTGIIKMNF